MLLFSSWSKNKVKYNFEVISEIPYESEINSQQLFTKKTIITT